MTLTAAARALWVGFHDAVEADLGPGGALHSICAFGAKMAEHAGRLAAVLTAYADPDGMEVNAEAMACGITLAQHYGAEMLRLHGGAALSPRPQAGRAPGDVVAGADRSKVSPGRDLSDRPRRTPGRSNRPAHRHLAGRTRLGAPAAGWHCAGRRTQARRLGTGAMSALSFDPWAALKCRAGDEPPAKAAKVAKIAEHDGKTLAALAGLAGVPSPALKTGAAAALKCRAGDEPAAKAAKVAKIAEHDGETLAALAGLAGVPSPALKTGAGAALPADAAGLTIEADGHNLRLRGQVKPPADLLVELRAHKAEILTLLTTAPRHTITVPSAAQRRGIAGFSACSSSMPFRGPMADPSPPEKPPAEAAALAALPAR